jgi:Tfp pilus assembly protein PilO
MSKDLRNTLIAIVVFIALAAGAGYLASDTKDQLEAKIHENEALQGEIDGFKKKIAEGPELKRQLDELNQNFKDYVKILPPAELATEEKLIRIVQSYCEAAQVSLSEIMINPPRMSGSEFEEVSVSFRLSSGFEQVVKFMNLLEQHEPFLKINSFSLNPAGAIKVVDGKEQIGLGIAIEVTTYKYVPKKS